MWSLRGVQYLPFPAEGTEELGVVRVAQSSSEAAKCYYPGHISSYHSALLMGDFFHKQKQNYINDSFDLVYTCFTFELLRKKQKTVTFLHKQNTACARVYYVKTMWQTRLSSRAYLWLNSLGKGEQEPERSLSTHLNPTCDSPAQVSYSGGSKMSLRGVFTDLVTPTHRPLGRQIHRYRIAFLVASVAMVRLEVTGCISFSVTQSSWQVTSLQKFGREGVQ